MTSPFAFNAPKPEPVAADTVAENANRTFAGFPDFSFGEIPPVVHSNARARPQRPPSKEMQQYAVPFKSFEPLNPAQYVVFGPANHTDAKVNEATRNLALKVASYLRKSSAGVIRIIQRTVVHPEDVSKPSHEQRRFLVGWRNTDTELSQ